MKHFEMSLNVVGVSQLGRAQWAPKIIMISLPSEVMLSKMLTKCFRIFDEHLVLCVFATEEPHFESKEFG